eukprot:s40_g12.t1
MIRKIRYSMAEMGRLQEMQVTLYKCMLYRRDEIQKDIDQLSQLANSWKPNDDMEEIRWALQALDLWTCGDIRVTKPRYGTAASANSRHCTVYLKVETEQEATRYIEALHGQDQVLLVHIQDHILFVHQLFIQVLLLLDTQDQDAPMHMQHLRLDQTCQGVRVQLLLHLNMKKMKNPDGTIGACSTAIAMALLHTLAQRSCPVGCQPAAFTAFGALVATLLGTDKPSDVAREVTHCSAKLSATKTHLILDVRPALWGQLVHYFSVIVGLLEELDGGKLGRKPAGGLARQARRQ